MTGPLTLTVITPERTVVKDLPTEAVILPVVHGSMGILPRHAPMVAALRIGILKYKEGGRYQPMAVAGGFAEVRGDHFSVLADAAERSGEIDVLRARGAWERALAKLRQRDADLDEARARRALIRALNRLRVADALEGLRVER